MLAGMLTVALAGCLAHTPSPSTQAAATGPDARAPDIQTGKRYTVDTQASEIRLLVYRDGPMARFGHNHVMVGQIRGTIGVSDDTATSGFRLEVPVDSLAVDIPSARTEEGEEFSATVSDQARKGTRDNMLGPDVLDAVHYPLILVDSESLSGPRWNPEVTAHITVRGTRSELKFPAAVIEQPGSLTVIATFSVRQSDLGIKPFSILGGAIRVRDAIDIRVRLVARPAAG